MFTKLCLRSFYNLQFAIWCISVVALSLQVECSASVVHPRFTPPWHWAVTRACIGDSKSANRKSHSPELSLPITDRTMGLVSRVTLAPPFAPSMSGNCWIFPFNCQLKQLPVVPLPGVTLRRVREHEMRSICTRAANNSGMSCFWM